MGRDEGREYVIHIRVALVAGGLLHQVSGLRTQILQAGIRRQELRGVVRLPGLYPGCHLLVELSLQAGVSRGIWTRRDLRIVRTVEQHRRRLERVEQEHEDAGGEDEQLKRDL